MKQNDVINTGCFLLPQIDSILDMLAGAKRFSTLDMKSSYWQLIFILITRRRLYSILVKGYGSSHSCHLASAVPSDI
jgi:hypothetical protein